MGILLNMRPRVVIHLSGKRWVFTMDSPKQYAKVLDRLKNIAGVDTDVLPSNLVAGQEVDIAVELPDELQEFISDAQLQSEMMGVFPCLKQHVVPMCDCYSNNGEGLRLKDLIIHLNDDHEWKREEIADWLESLDLDLEVAA